MKGEAWEQQRIFDRRAYGTVEEHDGDGSLENVLNTWAYKFEPTDLANRRTCQKDLVCRQRFIADFVVDILEVFGELANIKLLANEGLAFFSHVKAESGILQRANEGGGELFGISFGDEQTGFAVDDCFACATVGG